MNKIFLSMGLLAFSLNCTAGDKNKEATKINKENTGKKAVSGEKSKAENDKKTGKSGVFGICPTVLTTKSRHKFWYLQTTSAPKIKVHVLFRNVGSAHQTFEKSGLPALYARSVWCGAGEFKTRADLLAKESELSMGVRARFDADNLYFFFNAVTVDRNDAKEAFKVFLTVLSKPKFKENEVETERDDLTGELSTSTYARILSLVFPDHPYGRGGGGSIESLRKISVQDLKNFRKRCLTKGNAMVYIGGDLSPEEASEMCEQIYANLSNEKIVDEVEDVEPNLDGSISRYYTNGTQTTVNFIVKSVSPSSDKERVTAALLFRILGSSYCFKSRIMSVLRSQKGLIYSGGLKAINYRHAHLARGCLFIDNDKVDETIKATKEILSDLCEHGVTQEELNFFKTNFKGNIAVMLRTSESLHRFFISEMAKGKPVSVLDDFIKMIDEITLEDVNNMAKRLLKDVRFVVNGGQK